MVIDGKKHGRNRTTLGRTQNHFSEKLGINFYQRGNPHKNGLHIYTPPLITSAELPWWFEKMCTQLLLNEAGIVMGRRTEEKKRWRGGYCRTGRELSSM